MHAVFAYAYHFIRSAMQIDKLTKEKDVDEIEHQIRNENNGDPIHLSIKRPEALAIGRIYLDEQAMHGKHCD
jgi:hypothetical protein